MTRATHTYQKIYMVLHYKLTKNSKQMLISLEDLAINSLNHASFDACDTDKAGVFRACDTNFCSEDGASWGSGKDEIGYARVC